MTNNLTRSVVCLLNNPKVVKYNELGIEGVPPGKPGNCVTRMWAKTGWAPLKKDSELWDQVLRTIGQRNQQFENEVPQVWCMHAYMSECICE